MSDEVTRSGAQRPRRLSISTTNRRNIPSVCVVVSRRCSPSVTELRRGAPPSSAVGAKTGGGGGGGDGVLGGGSLRSTSSGGCDVGRAALDLVVVIVNNLSISSSGLDVLSLLNSLHTDTVNIVYKHHRHPVYTIETGCIV